MNKKAITKAAHHGQARVGVAVERSVRDMFQEREHRVHLSITGEGERKRKRVLPGLLASE